MTTEPLDETPRVEPPQLVVASIKVEDLFGRYSYKIEVPEAPPGDPGRLILIYGGNGTGKTTVLRLLWDLLSPSTRRGHRSGLAQTEFREFEVRLSDGTVISVVKYKGLVGGFDVTVRRVGISDLVVRYEADDSGTINRPRYVQDQLRVSSGVSYRFVGTHHDFSDPAGAFERHALDEERKRQDFEDFLGELEIRPLFLADDRTLYTDDERIERAREVAETRATSDPLDRLRPDTDHIVARELNLTVGRVNQFFRSLTISGQTVGSAGANSIYSNVLKQLSASPENLASSQDDISKTTLNSTLELLDELGERSPRFEEFELVPHFDAHNFANLLLSVSNEHRKIANEILGPYLTSVSARMSALEDAERMLRTLTTLLNDFFQDKKFTFSPQQGLRILTDGGRVLPPSALSSGERQLTMLLLTTLLARHDSTLFIIDEPELSLGVRWQRQIMSALLTLTEGTRVQFIVATHSVEMATAARESLVTLNSDPG